MSELIIIAFESEASATVARDALLAVQQAAGTPPEDIVMVIHKAAGEVTLRQSVRKSDGKPLGDGRWGIIIASLFLDDRDPKKQKRRGLAAVFRRTGLGADFLRDVSHSLVEGGAAVGMRLRALSFKTVLERLAGLDDPGRVMRVALDADVEAGLEAMRDVIPEFALPPSGQIG